MLNDNVKRDYYENNQLKTEIIYNNEDLKHGICKRWYENGQIAEECTYINGQLDGTFRSWHKNGQLGRESSLVDGLFHGISRLWSEKGSLLEEMEFFKGVQHGVKRNFDKNGKEKKLYYWYGQGISFEEKKAHLMADFIQSLGYVLNSSMSLNIKKILEPK